MDKFTIKTHGIKIYKHYVPRSNSNQLPNVQILDDKTIQLSWEEYSNRDIKEVCFISADPKTVSFHYRDRNGYLHREDGPALSYQYPNGYWKEEWYIHGNLTYERGEDDVHGEYEINHQDKAKKLA
jgi:hypothetical protein